MMEKIEKEKKRNRFSESERARLTQLVEARRLIIENKRCDSITNLEKNRAWEEITSQMNLKGTHPHRTTAQLRKLWENTKYRSKCQNDSANRESMRLDEDVSLNLDIPNHQDVHSVGFQEVTEAMDHRLNIYQGPDVKIEEDRTWDADRSEPFLRERERESEKLRDLRMKEAELKVHLLEKQIQHDEDLFHLRRKKLLLEIIRLEKDVGK